MRDATSSSAGSYTVIGSHVPRDVATAISKLAAANERSRSSEIRLAIKRHLADTRDSERVAAA